MSATSAAAASARSSGSENLYFNPPFPPAARDTAAKAHAHWRAAFTAVAGAAHHSPSERQRDFALISARHEAALTAFTNTLPDVAYAIAQRIVELNLQVIGRKTAKADRATTLRRFAMVDQLAAPPAALSQILGSFIRQDQFTNTYAYLADLEAHPEAHTEALGQLNREPADYFRLLDFKNPTRRGRFESITLDWVRANPEGAKRLSVTLLGFQPPKVPLSAIYDQFVAAEGVDDLYTFLLKWMSQGTRRADAVFLEELGADPAAMLTELQQLDPAIFHATNATSVWSALSLDRQQAYISRFAPVAAAPHHGIEVATWHPTQPAEKLMEELQECGPIVVTGLFGPHAYVEPPIVLERKIDGHQLYGWEPRAVRMQAVDVVIVFGMEKIGEDWTVYYMFPYAGSEVFTIPYPEFISNKILVDNYGFYRADANLPAGLVYAPVRIGYAFRAAIREAGEGGAAAAAAAVARKE